MAIGKKKKRKKTLSRTPRSIFLAEQQRVGLTPDTLCSWSEITLGETQKKPVLEPDSDGCHETDGLCFEVKIFDSLSPKIYILLLLADIPYLIRVLLISVTGGILFFIIVMYVRRWLLRVLLSYRGWMCKCCLSILYSDAVEEEELNRWKNNF